MVGFHFVTSSQPTSFSSELVKQSEMAAKPAVVLLREEIVALLHQTTPQFPADVRK